VRSGARFDAAGAGAGTRVEGRHSGPKGTRVGVIRTTTSTRRGQHIAPARFLAGGSLQPKQATDLA
jgi:hypothetical protein